MNWESGRDKPVRFWLPCDVRIQSAVPRQCLEVVRLRRWACDHRELEVIIAFLSDNGASWFTDLSAIRVLIQSHYPWQVQVIRS
jgi:hypothetical protein